MRKEAKAPAEFDAELEILEQYNSQLPDTTLQPTSQPPTPPTNLMFSNQVSSPATNFNMNQFEMINSTPTFTSVTEFTGYPSNFLDYHHCTSHLGEPLQSSTPRATSPSFSDCSSSVEYLHMVRSIVQPCSPFTSAHNKCTH